MHTTFYYKPNSYFIVRLPDESVFTFSSTKPSSLICMCLNNNYTLTETDNNSHKLPFSIGNLQAIKRHANYTANAV